MIGRDENQEEVTLKVVDRRKFNPDGSLKEGVVIEPTEPKKEEPIASEKAAAPSTPPSASEPPMPAAEPEDADMDEDDLSDVPGVNDPASFVNFLSTLATNAAAALGAVPHPATGQRNDKPGARDGRTSSGSGSISCVTNRRQSGQPIGISSSPLAMAWRAASA